MTRIKELRIAKGVTQEELAKVLNVKKAAISKYENGRVDPSINVLKLAAKYFDVPVDYIIGTDPASTPALPAEGADPRINKYYLLSSPAREQLLKYLDFLLVSDTPVLGKKAI